MLALPAELTRLYETLLRLQGVAREYTHTVPSVTLKEAKSPLDF